MAAAAGGQLTQLKSAVERWLGGVAARAVRILIGGNPASAAPLRPPIGPQVMFLTREPLLSDADWRRLLANAPADAVQRARAAARDGNVIAQVAYARMLLAGEGTPRDAAAGFAMAVQAAQSSEAAAHNLLGRCHELGWGTPADPGRAALHYRAAARQGDAWAQYNLATLLFEGNGVAADRTEALAFFLRAARGGNGKAMNMLGRYCEEGWHRRPRPVAAVHWYRRAAESGDFRGQFNFARVLFATGRRQQALIFLTRAVEGGIPSFCRAVGADLASSDDPALAALGHRALARAGAAEDPAS